MGLGGGDKLRPDESTLSKEGVSSPPSYLPFAAKKLWLIAKKRRRTPPSPLQRCKCITLQLFLRLIAKKEGEAFPPLCKGIDDDEDSPSFMHLGAKKLKWCVYAFAKVGKALPLFFCNSAQKS